MHRSEEVDEGEAEVALVDRVDGKVNDVEFVCEQGVDLFEQVVYGVFIGNVLDHHRCPLIFQFQNVVQVNRVLRHVQRLLLALRVLLLVLKLLRVVAVLVRTLVVVQLRKTEVVERVKVVLLVRTVVGKRIVHSRVAVLMRVMDVGHVVGRCRVRCAVIEVVDVAAAAGVEINRS